MKMKIAGGCGEHGRNCFYIESTSGAFLVDCGLMAGEGEVGFPHLSKEEILKVKYVFLTHSHADHTGAIPWLIDNGFTGCIIATKETLSQLPFEIVCCKTIDDFIKENNEIQVSYGKSGHCVGSVWYQFRLEQKTIFFSGDYVEENYVYEKELIRGKSADLAVLDCAYGKDDNSLADYSNELVRFAQEKRSMGKTLLLPVPKYGRGLEIYWLLKKHFPEWKYCADSHFLNQIDCSKDNPWIRSDIGLTTDIVLYTKDIEADVVFVSDPQLKSAAAQEIAEQVLTRRHAIMTGTVETGTKSEQLIMEKKMTLIRFPVHLNYDQFRNVDALNSFVRTVAYHTPEFDYVKEIEI